MDVVWLVLISPLLLLLMAVVALGLGVASLCYVLHRWWRGPRPAEPAPSAPPSPVRVLDTPRLVIELTDEAALAFSAEQEQLSDDWADSGDPNSLSLATTYPPLPGLHGRLVTGFCQPWHGGLLLQVVEPAAGEPAVTSVLGWADPATQTWQPLAEAGAFPLFHPEEASDNVIEGWNQDLGKIKLTLLPELPLNP
ncbi:hypothetical protein [Hymenobacter jeollabukensis]|uniref:Uncharacterized protein n=1 Tax=Hymenobacter jeollabukensis TaxID=2025313 RepID=A0A5R8WPC7_9BACT|nr:hypothetical protein [Hymenobacter jeollabukensis]TLM91908.1 hypothetical protein FDY95_15260 [Hymenobacter jeollabukensis]